VLNRPRRFDVVTEAEPAIGRDEVLLRVAVCGVCVSDLGRYQGQTGSDALPWYPGHEASGVVEQVGAEVTCLSPGDEVAAWVTGRGFAERVAVPAGHCVPAAGVPLGLALGEPLACAVNAVEMAAPELGDDIVIVGAGFMGHLIQKIVMTRGPRQVIVADTREEALRRARDFGAAGTVNVTRDPMGAAVRALTGGKGADVTFEVTGTQAALDGLHEVTRMSGTVVIAGYHDGASRQIPLGVWNWMAYRLINAHVREPAVILGGMRKGMRLMASGRVSLDGLVTHAVPLARIDEAFQAAIEKPAGFVKAVVHPNE